LADRDGLCSTEFIVMPGNDRTDGNFLRYRLNSPDFVSFATHLNAGDHPRVDFDQISSLQTFLPSSLAEQRRIVGEIEKQFTRLEAGVAVLRRVQANLHRYRAAVLKAACEGDWPRKPLADVAEIQGGIQKQPSRRPVKNHYPYLRVANVLRGCLDLSEMSRMELFDDELRKLRLQAGDLLIVEGNGSVSEIGRMAIWKNEVKDCVHQNHIIRARLAKGVLPKFAAIYWNSPDGQRRITEVASSTSGLYTLSGAKSVGWNCRCPRQRSRSGLWRK
jgi:type I restriction enzyme S subunit